MAITNSKTENGRKIETVTQQKTVKELPLESSRLNVDLNLEHRQKGLLWYSTYRVGFAGAYAFRNASDKERDVTFTLSFPTAQAIYDDLIFTVDDAPVTLKNEKNSASGTLKIAPGKVVTLKVGYKSQGLNNWSYSLAHGGKSSEDVARVRDFSLKMTTNFKGIDFPNNTLSPSIKRESGSGWQLDWNYPPDRVSDSDDKLRKFTAGRGRCHKFLARSALLFSSDANPTPCAVFELHSMNSFWTKAFFRFLLLVTSWTISIISRLRSISYSIFWSRTARVSARFAMERGALRNSLSRSFRTFFLKGCTGPHHIGSI